MMSDGNGLESPEAREPWTFFESKHDEPHKSPQFHRVPSNRRCFETDAVRYFQPRPLSSQQRTGLGHGVGRNLVNQTSH